MFTGLVQAVGRVHSIAHDDRGLRLSIDPGRWSHSPSRGDSISISGVCLTLANSPRRWAGVAGRRQTLEFIAVPETLRLTTLGSLQVGSLVNLEHAATPTTFLGGHIVQGHVDGLGRVLRVDRASDYRLWIELPSADLVAYIVPKGSICIDGVSLTVAGSWSRGRKRGFQVALIPETLERTTLAHLEPGHSVNLETDVIVKTVVHWLAARAPARPKRPRTTRK